MIVPRKETREGASIAGTGGYVLRNELWELMLISILLIHSLRWTLGNEDGFSSSHSHLFLQLLQ